MITRQIIVGDYGTARRCIAMRKEQSLRHKLGIGGNNAGTNRVGLGVIIQPYLNGWSRGMNKYIRLAEIPTDIETVSPEESARLCERQWRAKVWMKSSPFAMAMNAKLKVHLKRCADVTHI